MILCAGLGTRLRPLTSRWPKPAIPLLGQPLLRFTLAMLDRARITEVGINTHHLPEIMSAVAMDECDRLKMKLVLSHEPVIQGTAGGIRGLKNFLSGETFVVANGDVLFTLDLKSAIAAHVSSGADATMVLMPMPPVGHYGAVEQDPEGRIVRIAGQGRSQGGTSAWHFTGVHILSPAVFDFMSSSGDEDINRAVYPKMISKGLSLRGFVSDAYWSDVGNPSGYLATQRDLLHGRVPVASLGASSPFTDVPRRAASWISATARVDDRSVTGPAFFDAECAVDPSARIGGNVYVGRRSSIGANARLNRVCVLEETTIAENEVLVEMIAWGSHRIAAPLPAEKF